MDKMEKPATWVWLVCSAVATSLVAAATPAAAAETSPNFIVILADDQGWGTTSVLYDPQHPDSRSDYFQTPSIDRLAQSGMRFTQAYAAHPNCAPSRAAIQTGRSPAALHFTDNPGRKVGKSARADSLYLGNKVIPPHQISDLPLGEMTIPELLKANNPSYRAAHFGKWHLKGGGPSAHGYDASNRDPSGAKLRLEKNLPDDPKRAFSMTQRAIAWMKEQAVGGHPFYLQVSHYATHNPSESRAATRERFKQVEKGERHLNVDYAAMLYDLDVAIGQLLSAVDEVGIAESTFILYTADNGTYRTNDPGNINGPLRGFKTTIWEGGVRVPFVVAGPGIRAGSVSPVPVIGWDILPTVCELAGIATWPGAVEGGSLKPILLGSGKGSVQRSSDALVFHWPHYVYRGGVTPGSAILVNGWKLLYWWETGDTSLFHLDSDLDESEDLSERHPARAGAMKKQLMEYLRDVDAQLPQPNPDYDAASDPAKVWQAKAAFKTSRE